MAKSRTERIIENVYGPAATKPYLEDFDYLNRIYELETELMRTKGLLRAILKSMPLDQIREIERLTERDEVEE